MFRAKIEHMIDEGYEATVITKEDRMKEQYYIKIA